MNRGESFASKPAPTENHIRNTPKRLDSIGAFSDADKARASTSRVWAGSMTPSSHKRALE
ncbi:hypothetical protein D3C72_2519590 [compost metagenome]